MNKYEVNASTGEEVSTPLTGTELEAYLANEEAVAAKAAADREAEEAKATDKATLLAKLGITDDEAKLLLS